MPVVLQLLTFWVIVVLFMQPLLLAPVTVYVVLTVGLTISGFVFDPVLQVYVLAPPAVSVAVEPIHKLTVLDEALTVGKAFTFCVTVAVFIQPLLPVPVTV